MLTFLFAFGLLVVSLTCSDARLIGSTVVLYSFETKLYAIIELKSWSGVRIGNAPGGSV